LAALLLLVLASALAPIEAGTSKVTTKSFVENLAGKRVGEVERQRDEDLALYDRAIERIQHGENYYDFIAGEHRRANYPVTPGLAVRLPTLAYIDAFLGVSGQIAAAMVLLLAVLVAWWRRLGEEPGSDQRRHAILAWLFVGASLGLNRYYFVLHELWAGMLLVLAFGLHRVRNDPSPPGKGNQPQADGDGLRSVTAPLPSGAHGPATSRGKGGSWGWSLAVAALALAIREHALPFVLLMGAMAFWRRDWKEGVAWSALAALFLIALTIHLQIIAAQVLPSDRPSDPWLAMRGLSGWLSNIVLSSNLRFLPHWLAGPAVMLMLAGWAGWRSAAGTFGTFLYLGYGLAFMIAGRPDNFYWGAMIAPAMFIGLAFAPRALGSLARAAFPARPTVLAFAK